MLPITCISCFNELVLIKILIKQVLLGQCSMQSLGNVFAVGCFGNQQHTAVMLYLG